MTTALLSETKRFKYKLVAVIAIVSGNGDFI